MIRSKAPAASAAVMALVVLAGAGDAGCGGNDAQRDGVFVGGPAVPTGLQPAAIAVGASAVLPAQIGYVVTAATGPAWRVVWTGRTDPDRFFGSVYTTGRFTLVVPGCDGFCPVQSDDVISGPVDLAGGGQRVDFDAFTAVPFEGFDFVVDTAEQVVFDLQINGIREPAAVFFPALLSGAVVSTVNPAEIPFALVPSTGVVEGQANRD